MVNRLKAGMIRTHQVPTAGRVGNSNGIVVSSCWLLPIMAFAAAILSNVHICESLAFTLPRHQLGSRTILGIRNDIRNPPSSATKPLSSTLPPVLKASSSESSWSVQTILGRKDAQSLLDGPKFLPSMDYGDRIVFGRQAAEKEHGESETVGVMLSDDPRLARTYAEFPLDSLDILLDRACSYLPDGIITVNDSLNMVDIGSGLGRIVLYSALTRGANESGTNESIKANWAIRGIEISQSLHDKALELVQSGIDSGIFEETFIEENSNGEDRSTGVSQKNSFSFHCGSATDQTKLLQNAHLVFAYSTAFKAKEFDPDVGALILDTEEWSLPLSEACPDGCVVVTTDRALNPHLGWKMVERLDVPNPEVLGTTGFIHVLEKEESKQ